jgi:hypothetical protein
MSLVSELRSRIGKTLRNWRKDKHMPRNLASPGAYTIVENRPLSPEEGTLIEWLIANGAPEAKTYALQLGGLHVVARCSCGCPTVDLAVRDAQASTKGPSQILADFLGFTPEGIQVGVILHAREGKISELEVYPLGETVGSLPRIESLKRLE